MVGDLDADDEVKFTGERLTCAIAGLDFDPIRKPREAHTRVRNASMLCGDGPTMAVELRIAAREANEISSSSAAEIQNAQRS